MNHWAHWLAELPASLQVAIARANRVSLPRGSPAAARSGLLRAALCHQATVRDAYFRLEPAEQALLQELRACRRGLSADDLIARAGPIRTAKALRAAPRPQSLGERLILLGWLLPRPNRDPRRSLRYVLAPEVRAWLPRPLDLQPLAPAPATPVPPALRAAHVLLLAGADRPLPIRRDGRLRTQALTMLTPHLAPLPPDPAGVLLNLLLPRLVSLGLLAAHDRGLVTASAARRFLAQPPLEQLDQLRQAWVDHPHPDAWDYADTPLDTRVFWPALRRRLVAWSEALPAGLHALDGLYPAMAAALGPLVDSFTHWTHRTTRCPWSRRRAERFWLRALREPLAWFGYVTLAPDETAVAPGIPDVTATAPWRLVGTDRLAIPHGAGGADLLEVQPLLEWETSDASSTVYRVSPARIRRAQGQGLPLDRLRRIIEHRAGSLPTEPLPHSPAVQVRHGLLVLSEQPALLEQATRQRNVRRHLTRLAPGIALAAPESGPAVQRTLERAGLAVERIVPPPEPSPRDFTPAECRLLLEACAAYRQSADGATSDMALVALMQRLHAMQPGGQPFDAGKTAPAPAPAPPASASDRESVANEPQSGAVNNGLAAHPADDPVFENDTAWPDPVDLPCDQIIRHSLNEQPPLPTRWRLGHLLTLSAGVAALMLTVLRLRIDADAPERMPDEPVSQPLPTPTPLTIDARLNLIRAALRRRMPLDVGYVDAAGAVSDRRIRPVSLERNAQHWYLRAYCMRAGAERSFRLDRFTTMHMLDEPRRRGRVVPKSQPKPPPSKRAPARAGFFAPPPTTGDGHPYVGVWLEE